MSGNFLAATPLILFRAFRFKCHSVIDVPSVEGTFADSASQHTFTFLWNRTTTAKLWAPLPGLGGYGADLTRIWSSVSLAPGAGSGGHAAQTKYR